MLKNYELLYIIHPDLEGTSEKVTEKVAGFIKKAEGEVTNQEDWGKRKLAYRINKNDFGVYVLVNFNLESTNLPKIERDLRLAEEIMRSMIVVLPEMKEPKRSARSARKAAQKAEEAKEKPADSKPKVAPTKEEEKPAEVAEKKPRAKKADKAVEVVEKPAKKTATKTSEKTTAKKEKAERAETEATRMKKLDEKLGEILGE